MKKITLLCALGVSTGMLVTKMKKTAQELHFDAEIAAYSVDEFDTAAQDSDMILLGAAGVLYGISEDSGVKHVSPTISGAVRNMG